MNEDKTGPKTGKHYHVVYWNLDAPIWKEHDNEVKLMKYGDSKSVCFD